MLTNHSKTNRLLALITFFLSLILYVITLAPTASFWDPGEFIAVANGLQVTHPPGAPMFLLIGRIFSLFASPENVAYWVNMVSAVASALTIMFLYLIIVRLLVEFKGALNDLSSSEKITIYASGIIGSFAFAVSDTFWFSAVEAEVYALSMFFTSIVVWLTMKWSEHHDEPGNERWLVLISYMFGVALGVHLLNVLCLFFVALVVYFKKTEFKWGSFIGMGIASLIGFGLIYPFTVTQLATLAGSVNEATSYLISPITFVVLLIGLISWLVYYTHVNGYKIANIILLSYTMILIGYSSYALVFIRSIADPPIDENDPETIESFISYIKREQYGNTPIFEGKTYDNQTRAFTTKNVYFPRRYSTESRHVQKYAEYSSDWDYFVNYQVNHMYIRYFNWNFVGREADIQDTGWDSGFGESRYKDNPANNNYFFLPFLLGLLGMIFHFKKDWKRAIGILVLFFVTGLAIIIYLNQYPYQPRERDYAYVGSFFAFSIWVGIGFAGLMDGLKKWTDKSPAISYASFALVFLLVPGNMLYQNFDDHDRSKNYVAPDYAYNLLNSVAPYGILFTNGDNDTFPLWYLQEVENVRTDVRVVCLSLLNTPWYINQLKNQWSHESPPVELTMTDDQIKNIESKFSFKKASDFYEPQTLTFPVDKELLKNTFYAGSNEGELLTSAMNAKDLNFYVKSENIAFPYNVDSLDNEIAFYYEGNFLGEDRTRKLYYTRVQDDLILDIIRANKWKRPIYFAITVSRDGQMGLQNYFYLEGQAYRLIPKKHNDSNGKTLVDIHGERLNGFRFRQVNNPDVYYDENIRRMMETYRELFSSQVTAYLAKNNTEKALEWLKKGEEWVPFNTNLIYDYTSIIRYAYRYAQVGSKDDALRLVDVCLPKTFEDLAFNMGEIEKIESEATATEAAIRGARQNANMDKAYQLSAKMQNLMSAREAFTREIYYSASRIFVAQRVYWILGLDDKAVELANKANIETKNLIGFPLDSEANKRQVDRMILF